MLNHLLHLVMRLLQYLMMHMMFVYHHPMNLYYAKTKNVYVSVYLIEKQTNIVMSIGR